MEVEKLRSKETVEFINKLDELLGMIKHTVNKRDVCLKGERYLSSADVCKLLNIKTGTLQSYRDSGRIGFVKISRRILFRESDLIKILEQNYVNCLEDL